MLFVLVALLPLCYSAPSGSYQVADTKDDNIIVSRKTSHVE